MILGNTHHEIVQSAARACVPCVCTNIRWWRWTRKRSCPSWCWPSRRRLFGSLRSRTSAAHWWSSESAHIIVVIFLGEESVATDLNHMIHIVNVLLELVLYFYLVMVYVLLVKQYFVVEEMLFVVCTSGCTLVHASVCKDLSWPASSISYLT